MIVRVLCLALCAGLAVPAFAQGDAAGPPDEDAPLSESEDLARQLTNPVASLISVPFQHNLDFGGGPNDDARRYVLNVQPVVPVSISGSANLIVRTIVPVVYQDRLVPGRGSQFGLGDTVQSFFYSPKAPTRSGLIWGAGPVFLYPTATDRFTGSGKWGVGPSVVGLKQQGQSTFGVLANHLWSVAGDNDRNDISATFVQPFYSYTTRRFMTFSVSSETTYNWKSKDWLVPINASVSQLLPLGGRPVSIGIGGRYYPVSPRGGPDWGLRLTTTLLFPKR